MGSFHRVDTSKLVRGAARFLWAPASQPKPRKISDVIRITNSGAANEIQTLSVSGTPTGGQFNLTFAGATVAVDYDATSAEVQTALEGLATIGDSNVTCTGGPLPGTPVVITFGGVFANQNVPLIEADGTALTGGTDPEATIVETTAGVGIYDAMPGWNEFGATREGIQITINNGEDAFEVDQVQGEIGTAPNNWECAVTTRLAESTMENFVIAWEGADITTDLVEGERETGFAGAMSYTERRLAVLFKRPSDKLVGYFFHRAVRSPQEGTIDFRKGGEPQTIQVRFKVLADASEPDPKYAFFRMREQI